MNLFINIIAQIGAGLVIGIFIVIAFLGTFTLFQTIKNCFAKNKNCSILGTRKYGENFHKENNEE